MRHGSLNKLAQLNGRKKADGKKSTYYKFYAFKLKMSELGIWLSYEWTESNKMKDFISLSLSLCAPVNMALRLPYDSSNSR